MVIAMMGILSVVIYLLTPSVPEVRLDAAAKTAASDVAYAQQYATLTGNTAGVAFFSTTDSYTVYVGSAATPLVSPLTKQNMTNVFSDNFPGISISNDYTIEFNAMGAPSTGGGGSVTFSDGTNAKVMAVRANTGNIDIQ